MDRKIMDNLLLPPPKPYEGIVLKLNWIISSFPLPNPKRGLSNN
jgi:hypothetical protein